MVADDARVAEVRVIPSMVPVFRPGTVLDGSYTLHRPLGVGELGVVYEASQGTGCQVAVKVLHASLCGEASDFEARLAECLARVSALRSPHTLVLLDHGRAGQDGHYVVHERVGGDTLAALLWAEGTLSPAHAAFVGRKVCDSLVEAHRAGLYHGHLSTRAILLPSLRVERLKVTRYLRQGLLGQRGVCPCQQPPEQLRGADLGVATDIYGLGQVLFELLTGRPPFPDESPEDALRDKLAGPPSLPPPHTPPFVSPALCQVVERCLSPDPDARYPSAVALRRALSEAVDEDCAARPQEAALATTWRYRALVAAR